MRELTSDELEQLSGGVVPVIAFGAALAGHMSGFSGVAGWAISSVGLVTASYGLAEYGTSGGSDDEGEGCAGG
jgi:lactobin A/cerein 7B family class IIb bacteriocin